MGIRPICRSCRKPKKSLPCFFPGVGWLCRPCFDRIVQVNIKENTKHLKDPPTRADYERWSRENTPRLGPEILGDPDCPHCKKCPAYETCVKNFMHSQGDCASHRDNCGLPHIGSVQLTLTGRPLRDSITIIQR